tara:strand:- start:460 stop:1479 length:1020 start_codon:yes stop_codon:yes gene_type:complete
MTQIPPLQPAPVGAFRFNTDSTKMEYYDGNQWVNVTSTSPQVQTGGTRGLMAGGANPTLQDNIDYINTATRGNAIDFGDLLNPSYMVSGCASRTRGLFHGFRGSPNARDNVIEHVTISSTGNAADYGDLTNASSSGGQAWGSSNTRAIMALGWICEPSCTAVNNINYATIASTGNAVDFGDLTQNWAKPSGAVASPTRWCISGAGTNNIDYVTISTLGNGADFGDLTDGTREEGTGASNAVRGLFCGGSGPGSNKTTDYITIAQLGNALDFGDLTDDTELAAAMGAPTRVVVGGGTTPSKVNNICYFTIATLGDAIDFGDRTITGYGAGSCSNGHGGIG